MLRAHDPRQLRDPAVPAQAKNATLIPAAQKITSAERQVAAAEAARDQAPAKLPANEIDPDAKRALLRTSRRILQMVLRLLAHNAEHWLSRHLNACLCDDDEYRAITRQTVIRGIEQRPRKGRPLEKVLIIVVEPNEETRCRCPECGHRGRPVE